VTATTATDTSNPRFWNSIANKYAKSPVEDPDAFDRKIAFTKERLAPGRTLLDVGCGTGSLALRLADTGADIHGLDASSEMVRIGNEKKAAQGAHNVSFHVDPFDETFRAFGPESLDVFCAYSILHLVGDRARFLTLARTLLKPGGAFISSTLCLAESWVPYGWIIGGMRLVGKAPYVAIFTKAQLEAEIRSAGFENVREVDVGAKATVAFMAAEKPASVD